jgi:hypothetical protein
MGVIGGVTVVALLFIGTLLIWNALVPEDDPDEQALATLLLSGTSTPNAAATPSPETPTSTQEDSSQDTRAPQQVDAVIAKREAAMLYPVPETCRVFDNLLYG